MKKRTKKKIESLELTSISKEKSFYVGTVIKWYDTVKCKEGYDVKFKQKNIPKELEYYVGKDLSKYKRTIYVNCETSQIESVSSTVVDGGEEYEVPSMPTNSSKVKILSFDMKCNSVNSFTKLI